MNPEDKIYHKIKSASNKGETPNFDAMDKVWSRIEDKLETNALKKQNNNWKKIAVAAAILIVSTITYTFFNTKPQVDAFRSPIVNQDSLQTPLNQDTPLVETEVNNTIIPEKEAVTLIENQSKLNQNTVAVQYEHKEVLTEKETQEETIPDDSANGYEELKKEVKSTAEPDQQISSFMPESAKMKKEMISNFSAAEVVVTQPNKQSKIHDPLIVIDGEAVPSKTLKQLHETEVDSVLYLPNPLYIINGVEYTEKELFGPNPTSPYAPLNKQDITKTTVLQTKEAVQKYGSKGQQGVVIITTKNGKPKN
ncbi:hypothetical protein ACFS5J_06075 [Flavobacterium chuncheonense]|uniref:TonB-dependent receptor plug domain-containing protein n=1 Tax=Flavobacterium chuncheonense TaxID=2026653 RepID=A0ABW5YME6_9FLAO